ncbi:hypothetical protein SAMN04487972_10727 [Paracoccus halophilus]|uniref:D-galactarate dehydratase n=1 Tax=Paracoccus halophilus TaxID=376733 RepID=A0A099F2J4_9RHOB|nr:hypothetical protein [Paracoccus halophilus]KGJ04649.1 hypothetical protein IT41_09840 [Paracoccus halophilus]SFA49871.1 hypothetical protein SAMN04487972_10727 [Paracoccus halophilus]
MTAPALRIACALSLLALTACTTAGTGSGTAPPAAPKTPGASASSEDVASAAVTPVLTAAPPSPAARTAAEFDTTSRAQKADAAAPPVAAERRLGSTIASLGDPSVPGFWVKTPLVRSEVQGRILNPANGKSAKVRLIPLAGPASAGSQVSLPALQLIGVSLTDLPMIEVYES